MKGLDAQRTPRAVVRVLYHYLQSRKTHFPSVTLQFWGWLLITAGVDGRAFAEQRPTSTNRGVRGFLGLLPVLNNSTIFNSARCE